MLDCLMLRGAPAFDPNGVLVGPLKPVNFLFGTNGSGKTTISRALTDPRRFPGSALSWVPGAGALGVRTYNRDYVDETIRQAANLPGVFLLGKTSQEIQDEIDELSAPEGSIAASGKRLDHLSQTLAVKESEIAVAQKALREAAWLSRVEVPPELQAMFAGFNNSKENLASRVVDVASKNAEAIEEFPALVAEAAAVLAEDASRIERVPFGPPLRLETLVGGELFAIPIVGSAEVRLSSLIQELHNADWVQHGLAYLPKADGRCPFCQQSVPPGLGEQLDAYFDTRYTQQISTLKSFRHAVEGWAREYQWYLDALETPGEASGHLDDARLKAGRLEFERDVRSLLAQIDDKLARPSNVIELKAPTRALESISAAVRTANVTIDAFNHQLKNRATARASLLARCWVVFVRRTLATEVGRFEGEMVPLSKAKGGLETALAECRADLQTKRARLKELQGQVTSTRPVIATINRLLASVGFHSFTLTESSSTRDGYSLRRENGEIASDSLSEGERTFITFLYYVHSLEGTDQDADEVDDLLAVIDDPISSLDSDVVYAVSILVRRIVEDIVEGKGRVRQLVVLTHNAHFHKEITYKRRGTKDASWQFGVVRKRHGQHSELVLSSNNPVQTGYAALWSEVHRVALAPHASAVGLQNVLRRILETYFKVLGGVDDAAIIAQFNGDEAIVCRSLFSWVNAGSHSIFDDLDYSATSSTVETSLEVFRSIFALNGQEGHYLMMMGGEQALAAATVPGAPAADDDRGADLQSTSITATA